jgi:rhodanese-related sulfurtransferase
MNEWEKAPLPFDSIPTVQVSEVMGRTERHEPFPFLDVRQIDEIKEARPPESRHIFLGGLPGRLGEIPRERPIIAFCDSGRRSRVAASILKWNGFKQVENFLGSISACRAAGCPIVRETGSTQSRPHPFFRPRRNFGAYFLIRGMISSSFSGMDSPAFRVTRWRRITGSRMSPQIIQRHPE